MKSKSSKLTQTVSHVWVQLESFIAATRDLPLWVVTLMLASAIFYRTRIIFCGEIKAQDRKKLKQDATTTTNIYLHGNFEKLIQKNIWRDNQKGSQIQPKHTMNHDFSNAQFLSTRNKVDNVEYKCHLKVRNSSSRLFRIIAYLKVETQRENIDFKTVGEFLCIEQLQIWSKFFVSRTSSKEELCSGRSPLSSPFFARYFFYSLLLFFALFPSIWMPGIG